MPFEDGDALAFISSSAMTIGQAALAAHDLAKLSDAALIVAALSVQALGTNGEAFAAQVRAKPTPPTHRRNRERLRVIVRPTPSGKVQDSYGTRALPQVHGTMLDALDRLNHVLNIELNAGAENPLRLDRGGGDLPSRRLAPGPVVGGGGEASTWPCSAARNWPPGDWPSCSTASRRSWPTGRARPGLLILEYTAAQCDR